MAVSFPRTDLFTTRAFTQQSFDLASRQELSVSAGGGVIGKDLGEALWMAEWTTAPEEFDDAVTFEAMLRSLDGVIGTFTAYDLRRPYPKLYSDGSFTDSGQINAIESNKALSLKSLPANFALSVGDYLAFTYNTTERALHQVVEAVTANGSGLTAAFEVRPHIRAGAAANAAVTLKKPSAIFGLQVNGMTSSMQDAMFGIMTFKAVQAIY